MNEEIDVDSTSSPAKVGMPRKQKPLLGQGMVGSDRLPQKFERYDPWPSVPFTVEQEVPSKGKVVGYIAFAAILMWVLL